MEMIATPLAQMAPQVLACATPDYIAWAIVFLICVIVGFVLKKING
jgi:hypothetical protein